MPRRLLRTCVGSPLQIRIGGGLRLERHVEAVVERVVDQQVEAERMHQLAARAPHDVHARAREAVTFEPALGLDLRRRASRLGPPGEKKHLPALGRGDLSELLHHARLELVELSQKSAENWPAGPAETAPSMSARTPSMSMPTRMAQGNERTR